MYPVRQGPPSEHPNLNVLDSNAARKYEAELIDSNDSAVAWDRRADARQAAWDASPFAASFDRLLTLKRNPPSCPTPSPLSRVTHALRRAAPGTSTPATNDPVVPLPWAEHLGYWPYEG